MAFPRAGQASADPGQMVTGADGAAGAAKRPVRHLLMLIKLL
jgi:hypothetical protein